MVFGLVRVYIEKTKGTKSKTRFPTLIQVFSTLRQAFLDRKKVLKTSDSALSKYDISEGLLANGNKENRKIVKWSRKSTFFDHPQMVDQKNVRKKIKFDPTIMSPIDIISILGVWRQPQTLT